MLNMLLWVHNQFHNELWFMSFVNVSHSNYSIYLRKMCQLFSLCRMRANSLNGELRKK